MDTPSPRPNETVEIPAELMEQARAVMQTGRVDRLATILQLGLMVLETYPSHDAATIAKNHQLARFFGELPKLQVGPAPRRT